MQLSTIRLHACGLSKTFVLHAQGGVVLPVFNNIELEVHAGECVCLDGPSGTGKSTLLRSLYANYKADGGSVWVDHCGERIDLQNTETWRVVEIRRKTIGYVSQFLRVIPRVTTLDAVAETAILAGEAPAVARDIAKDLLARLHIPQRLWSLAPATFSGGEQQRVNIARSLVGKFPILLVDEPTASLDEVNRQVVVRLIIEAKQNGAAIVGIFHDKQVRDAISDRAFNLKPMRLGI